MGVLQMKQVDVGHTGSLPYWIKMVTTDNLATITTAGYLNNQALLNVNLSPSDIIFCLYNYNISTNQGTYAQFTVSISNGVYSLVQYVDLGNVVLPVVSGDFAVFTGTTGQILDAGYLPSNPAKTKVVMANGATILNHIATYADTSGTVGIDAATAINGGNIQAGFSGTAGTVGSFPAAATSGELILAAVTNATGNFNTTISNASAIAQSQVISIPDSGSATSNFLLSSSGGTQHITTGSLQVDAGNVIAGISGAAGTVGSFPAAATSGELILAAATNSSGNFNTTISNATSVAQSQVISIPDSGATTANVILSKSGGTQHITAGSLQVDAGGLLGGLSTGGTAGSVTLYPVTAANGSLIVSPINAGGAFNTTISNSIMGQSSVISIPDPGASTSNFVLSQSSLASNNVTYTKVVTVTFTQLATAAKVNIAVHPTATARFAILDIKVFTSTGLSGGGGNRLLSLSDGTIVFNNAGITAALLGTPIFTLWGGTGNPVAVGTSQVSTAGADVYLQYIGGTTDYTAGSVQLAITLVQVVA